MKKLITIYINQPIQQKLMIVMLVVLGLTVGVLSYSNITVLNRSFSEVTNEQTIEMAGQVTLRIENFIGETNQLISYIISEPSMGAFVDGQLDGEGTQELLSAMDRYSDNNRDIAGILVVDKQGNSYSTTMEVVDQRPLIFENWYIESSADPYEYQVFSRPIGRNVTSFYDSYKADNIISVAKAIVDENGTVTGVILVDMKLDEIESIINSANLSDTGFLFIADNNGDVVYGPVNDVIYRIHNSMLKDDQLVDIQGKTYQIMQQATGIRQWRIVGVFPQDVTTRIIVEVISYFVIFALLILVVATLFLSLLTRAITRPISELRGLMEQAEQGELDVRFESEYDDEVSKLGTSFNSMLESIDRLLKLVYVEQKAKREAELKAFQAQIKPHFLYNTLDTINWMAMEYEADDIVEVIQSLTNLFRISLSKGNEIISLRNEMLHVSSYLTIQKVRYEDQFDYEVDWDMEWGDCQVVKLIIQPIVENAIYHGIKGSGRTEFIRIKVRQEEDLIITVTDSGSGMTEDEVMYFNDVFGRRREKKDTTGIGLINVNERIKMNYGDPYGLTISSDGQNGTKVVIRHPII